ncbi:hypothetical protein HK102_011881 [Quaeritorhiza haematococci]|nr:hypothetical protein HK102_011881 [Quaeritorhiza haematococci]
MDTPVPTAPSANSKSTAIKDLPHKTEVTVPVPVPLLISSTDADKHSAHVSALHDLASSAEPLSESIKANSEHKTNKMETENDSSSTEIGTNSHDQADSLVKAPSIESQGDIEMIGTETSADENGKEATTSSSKVGSNGAKQDDVEVPAELLKTETEIVTNDMVAEEEKIREETEREVARQRRIWAEVLYPIHSIVYVRSRRLSVLVSLAQNGVILLDRADNERLCFHQLKLSPCASFLSNLSRCLPLRREKQEEQLDDLKRKDRAKHLYLLIEKAGVYSSWLAEKLAPKQQPVEQQPESTLTSVESPSVATSSSVSENPAVDTMGEDILNDPTIELVPPPPPEPATERPVTRRKSTRVGAGTKKSQDEDAAPTTTKGKRGRKRKSNVEEEPKTTKRQKANIKGGSVSSSSNVLEIPKNIPVRQSVNRQPELVTGCTMREYQLVGMEWLIGLFENGLNGILADEMGLGKRFTPSIPVVLYHGNADIRGLIRAEHFTKSRWEFPVVVTSYEICMNDRKYLQNFKWKYIIIDEGHRIKNMNCRLMRELKSLPSENRLLLTGTPLQNNLTELWSLLNWLMPEIFNNIDEFSDWFDFSDDLEEKDSSKIVDKEMKTQIITNLYNILRPFLLRRIKSEVEKDLPKKKEYLIYCPLVPKQKELYDAALGGVAGLREFVFGIKNKGQDAQQQQETDGNGSSSSETPEVEMVDGDSSSGAGAEDGVSLVESPAPVDDDENGNQDEVESVASKVESEPVDDEATDPSAAKPKGRGRGKKRPTPPVPTRQSSRRRQGSNTSYKEVSDREFFANLEKEAKEAKLKGKREKSSSPAVEAKPKKAEPIKALSGLKLQNLIMQLRKVCNHPFIFQVPEYEEPAEDEFEEAQEPDLPHIPRNPLGNQNGDAAMTTSAGTAIESAAKVRITDLPDIVAHSGKMLMLERLLPELFARGHKVLIFSQMTKMLDIIQDWCEYVRGWNVCRIDGSVKMEERKLQIQDFNTQKDHNLFLLSTRAGGLGINLTAADTVIIYDSDWNPQMDLQAQDRAHRIGQTRPVIVYRLVTTGTVESNILNRAAAKRRLEKLVIHRNHFKGSGKYYQQKQQSFDASELADIFTTEESEEVRLAAAAAAAAATNNNTNVGDDTKETATPSSATENKVASKRHKLAVARYSIIETLDQVISDKELERILDRSPAAFEKGSKGKEKSGEKADGKSGEDGQKEEEEDETDEGVRFRVLEEERDDMNDALADSR